jgi:hypothetical protein
MQFSTFPFGNNPESTTSTLKNLIEAYNIYARGIQELQDALNMRVEDLSLECLRACREAASHPDGVFRMQEANHQYLRAVREELGRDEHRKQSDQLFQHFLNAGRDAFGTDEVSSDPATVAAGAQIVMAGALLANNAMLYLKAKSQ